MPTLIDNIKLTDGKWKVVGQMKLSEESFRRTEASKKMLEQLESGLPLGLESIRDIKGQTLIEPSMNDVVRVLDEDQSVLTSHRIEVRRSVFLPRQMPIIEGSRGLLVIRTVK